MPATVLHAGVAGGVGLAFAAVALARGAQALGGVGERERDEEDKRGERRDQAAAEWGEDEPERVRNEKGHALRVLGEVARRS